MTQEQRGYLWGELYPAIAEGIDLLLIAAGFPPAGRSARWVHERAKQAFGVATTTAMTRGEAAEYLTQLQAFAAECLIFIASPDEWRSGTDWRARNEHYAFVLGS